MGGEDGIAMGFERFVSCHFQNAGGCFVWVYAAEFFEWDGLVFENGVVDVGFHPVEIDAEFLQGSADIVVAVAQKSEQDVVCAYGDMTGAHRFFFCVYENTLSIL